MEKQSQIVKALQAALDELEVLVIEGENLDLDVVEGLMAKFEKLKKTIEEKNKK
jgi:hypothetical protein